MQLTCLSWTHHSQAEVDMVQVQDNGNVVAEISDEFRQLRSQQDVNTENISDESLMLEYQSGDIASFDQLYARYRDHLYRYMARQLTGEPESLNELFQDVWLKLIRARQSYSEISSFKTYLFQIANNTIRDYFRRSAVRKIVVQDPDLDVIDQHAGPGEQVQINQQYRQLLQALQTLPQQQRDVFLLKEEAGLSIQQIAEVVDANSDTVKSRLRYAVSKLREALIE